MKQNQKFIVIAAGTLVLVIVATAALTSQLVVSQMASNTPMPTPSQTETPPPPIPSATPEPEPKTTPDSEPKPKKTPEVEEKPPVQVQPFGGQCQYAFTPYLDWNKTVAMVDVYGVAFGKSASRGFYQEMEDIYENTDRNAFDSLDFELLSDIRNNVNDISNFLINFSANGGYGQEYRDLLRVAYANEQELAVSCSRYIASAGIKYPR